MKKIVLLVGIVMSSLNGNAFLRMTSICQLASQVRHLKALGRQRIWWVTDLDGTLVYMPSFRVVQGEKTKTTFDETNQMVERVVGLTAAEKMQASKIAQDLETQGFEFHDEDNLHNQLIGLDGNSLNALFNGIVYAGSPKGQALVAYINFVKMLDQKAPDALIFTDDKEKNAASVAGAMSRELPEIHTVSCHYVPQGFSGYDR